MADFDRIEDLLALPTVVVTLTSEAAAGYGLPNALRWNCHIQDCNALGILVDVYSPVRQGQASGQRVMLPWGSVVFIEPG
jgi:hypothetical protein